MNFVRQFVSKMTTGSLVTFVENVRTKSDKGDYLSLVESLNGARKLLADQRELLDDVLNSLNFQQHSLGVLFVLLAKFDVPAKANIDPEYVLKLYTEFITECKKEQVQHATHAYYELCHLFTNIIINEPFSIHGITVVAQAIVKIRESDSQLTHIHADLIKLSLQAYYFKTALNFLDVDITTISRTNESQAQHSSHANDDTKYFLQYYYYGGKLYAAFKNFERALFFFEVCVSIPASAMSITMLEAYKKFILVSLIVHGKIMPLPKHSSDMVRRFMKPHVQAYHELATAYTTSYEAVHAAMRRSREVFARDQNLNLVKLVVNSLFKRNIQQLAKVFSTLSLSDVASKAELPDETDAETFLLNMIKSGEIYAKINQKDGVVIFEDNPEKYNSPETLLKLKENITNIISVIKQINQMEEETLLDPEYVKADAERKDDE